MTTDAAQLQIDKAKVAMRIRAQEIADDLIGTAKSLHDVLRDGESEDDSALMEAAYELCFDCDCCGWWASTEELHNETGQEYDEMCDECFEGEEE